MASVTKKTLRLLVFCSLAMSVGGCTAPTRFTTNSSLAAAESAASSEAVLRATKAELQQQQQQLETMRNEVQSSTKSAQATAAQCQHKAALHSVHGR